MAQQAKKSGAVQVKAADIGGVVTSSKGPEAGVWVVAETTDLPTKYVKIVVTDDAGRYSNTRSARGLLSALGAWLWPGGFHAGRCQARRFHQSKSGNRSQCEGSRSILSRRLLVFLDSGPGQERISDEAHAGAALPHQRGTCSGQRYYRAVTAAANARSRAPTKRPEFSKAPTMATQEQWIDTMKQGCELCHQQGDFYTRDLTHLARYNFTSSQEAWATRIHFGQAGYQAMSGTLARFVDQPRAIKMYADWTDRIAAGEVPPSPPRPQGIERNVVITMWDWGKVASHPHDEVATDRRHPTVNANGRIYAADYNTDSLLWVDPTANTSGTIALPTIEDKSKMRTTWPQKVAVPSPYFGDQMALGDGVEGPHNPMMDQLGRVWVTSTIRQASEQPDFCKQGSDDPFAQYFPMPAAGKHVQIYDPETQKATAIDTCFSTHHLQLAEDKDNTMYFSSPGGQAFGWINSRILAETGDPKKAQGWCPAYLDTNGDGKIEPGVDKRIPVRGYGIIVNPTDGSIWMATTGPTPGHLLRISLGSNPPTTCMAEVYEPPFNNAKAPGVFGYAPRGVDVDRNGVIWTALSGSSQLASFDRRKCKVTSGPTATGQQCPEGWTLYTTPGPKMKGVTDDSSADFEYYNWVDQFNTLGLGDNTPIIAGTDSDSIEAFNPSTKKWVILRVPYPLGFYTRGMDGRIDDAKAGWKGRGVWATYGEDLSWHTEGGPGTLSKLVKFQIRPNPLAN